MKLSFFIVFSVLAFATSGQNLVPNPSFEDSLKPQCDWIQRSDEFSRAVKDWFVPTDATTDYFSTSLPLTCRLNPNSINSNANGPQAPRTGEHYIGLVPFGPMFDAPFEYYREYASVKLTSQLEVGKVYEAEMYVSLSDSVAFATNNLGMYFSDTSLETNMTISVLDYEPQVLEKGIIVNTDDWTLIRRRFKAESNHEFITIGNFYTNIETDSVRNAKASRNGNVAFSYYYIDDVSVTESTLVFSDDSLICQGDSIQLTSFGESITGWAVDSAPSILISTDDTVKVAPSKPTNYLLITQGDTFSVKLDVIPKYELELGNDTIICIGETLNSQVPATDADITWQNGSKDSIVSISESGTYWVSVDDYCGTYTDTIKVDFIDCAINLEMPNVFSPNNDGVNEYFQPITIYGIGEGQLLIYNRNGEQVYESYLTSAQWDGTHNDLDCPEGVYYWVASYQNILGEQKLEKGFLTLVR